MKKVKAINLRRLGLGAVASAAAFALALSLWASSASAIAYCPEGGFCDGLRCGGSDCHCSKDPVSGKAVCDTWSFLTLWGQKNDLGA